MSANPLVVQAPSDGLLLTNMTTDVTQSYNAFSGDGLETDVANIIADIKTGTWSGGILDGVGTAIDVYAFATDPLQALVQAGIGWLIEHVSFLKEGLDALVGNQAEISAISSTWVNISTAIGKAATDLGTAVSRDTASWHGLAADAYRVAAGTQGSMLRTLSGMCYVVALAVDVTGVLLNVVRGIVRDLVAQAVAEIIIEVLADIAAEALTVGLATPVVIAAGVGTALLWADRIAEWLDQLKTAMENLAGIVKRLGPLGEALVEIMKNLTGGTQLHLKTGKAELDLTNDAIKAWVNIVNGLFLHWQNPQGTI